jgi:CRISPR-associated protein (Cas_Cmr5)
MSTPALESRPQVAQARAAVAEARHAGFPLQQYGRVVSQLPRLFQRHGLGQLLAFLQQRAEGNPRSPYHLVYRQLDAWVLFSMGSPAPTALGLLAARDSRFYREATAQAWLFLYALREQIKEA